MPGAATVSCSWCWAGWARLGQAAAKRGSLRPSSAPLAGRRLAAGTAAARNRSLRTRSPRRGARSSGACSRLCAWRTSCSQTRCTAPWPLLRQSCWLPRARPARSQHSCRGGAGPGHEARSGRCWSHRCRARSAVGTKAARARVPPTQRLRRAWRLGVSRSRAVLPLQRRWQPQWRGQRWRVARQAARPCSLWRL